MKAGALHDRSFVRRGDQTAGENALKAEELAMGTDTVLIGPKVALEVNVGDRAPLGKYSGTPLPPPAWPR